MNNLEKLKLANQLAAILNELKTDMPEYTRQMLLGQIMVLRDKLGLKHIATFCEEDFKTAIQNPKDVKLLLKALVNLQPKSNFDKELLHAYATEKAAKLPLEERLITSRISEPDLDGMMQECKEMRQKGASFIGDMEAREVDMSLLAKLNHDKKILRNIDAVMKDSSLVGSKAHTLASNVSDEVGFTKAFDEFLELHNLLSKGKLDLPNDEVSKLVQEYMQKREQIKKLESEREKIYLERLAENEDYQKAEAAYQTAYDNSTKAGTTLVNKLIEHSEVSEDEANEWVKKHFEVDKTAAARLKKNGYPKEQVMKDAAEFYRLTGGRMNEVQIITRGDKRAATVVTDINQTSIIYIDSEFDKQVLWHEMGHNLEKDSAVRSMAKAFLARRRESSNLYPLKDLTNNNSYGREEVAYKDSWINPYIGKYYKSGMTEVFSMGLEYLSDPVQATDFMAKDRDMFEMIVGYLSEKKSDVYKFIMQHAQAEMNANKAEEEQIKNEDAELTYPFDVTERTASVELVINRVINGLAAHKIVRRGTKADFLGVVNHQDKQYFCIFMKNIKNIVIDNAKYDGKSNDYYIILTVENGKIVETKFYKFKREMFAKLDEMKA